MFSPKKNRSAIENYLTYLEKKRTREQFKRHMGGEKCSSEDALLCLQAVESYARRGAHTQLLNSVSTSMKQLEQIMAAKRK